MNRYKTYPIWPPRFDDSAQHIMLSCWTDPTPQSISLCICAVYSKYGMVCFLCKYSRVNFWLAAIERSHGEPFRTVRQCSGPSVIVALGRKREMSAHVRLIWCVLNTYHTTYDIRFIYVVQYPGLSTTTHTTYINHGQESICARVEYARRWTPQCDYHESELGHTFVKAHFVRPIRSQTQTPHSHTLHNTATCSHSRRERATKKHKIQSQNTYTFLNYAASLFWWN